MADFGEVNNSTTLTRIERIDINNFRKGVTQPTEVTIGTIPSVPALLFDAIAETASMTVGIPIDMDLTVNPILLFAYELVNAQSNAHQLDLSIDYVVPNTNTTGEGAAKANTNLLATQQVTTANGLAAGDPYILTQAIDIGDATNPIGVNSVGIGLEIHLTNLTDIAAIHLLGAGLQYEALY